MEGNSSEGALNLEQIRETDGNDACINAFKHVRRNDKQGALTLLNDVKMTFSTLYLLMPEIEDLLEHLSTRNMTAAKIIDEVADDVLGRHIDLAEISVLVYETLLWMLHTGHAAHALDSTFQKVMDIVCSVLLDTYAEKRVLPIVCDLIFARKARGQCIHDLIWSFFRTKDPETLKLVAKRLGSQNADADALARRLLNMGEGTGSGDTDMPTDRAGFMQWLEKNEPFLFFTGLGYQYSSRPVIWGVDYNGMEVAQ
ncbi:MAG: hypothetical protein LUG13_06985 [Oscillospiraceae bacterium]|nr:hypothetical protein [Oscillospiraceae bacterium]